MSNIRSINIPEKCHQSWDKMSPEGEGRHCQSCNKTVVDFTVMSNRQIINYLNLNSRVCGKIEQHQIININNNINVEAVPASNKLKGWAMAMGLLGSIIFFKADAQVKASTEQTEPVIGKIYNKPQEMLKEEIRTIVEIKGTVFDEKNVPFPGVLITCKGTNGTQTDVLGHFKLKLPINAKQFEVRFVGYNSQIVNIDTKSDTGYYVKLNPSYQMLGEVVVAKWVKPNFFKRTYYKLFKKKRIPFKYAN